MGLRVILSILAGGGLGITVLYLTRRLIQNRTSQPIESLLLNGRWTSLIWIITGAVGCGFIAFWIKDIISSMEYMGIFLALISLAVVDGSIRKIPNELLLALLVIKLAAAVISGNFGSLLPALIGFIAGLVLFIIPSYFRLGIGWGDIKLAAVAGFCLGLVGILQAVFIMAIVLAFYSLYLIMTKKGNLRTSVAIGPSLSLGMMAALLFPLVIAI